MAATLVDMPSPSATGTVTVLSSLTADMIERVQMALTLAHEDGLAFTSEGLAGYWPTLPTDEFAAAFCARTKPAAAIAAEFRRSKVPTMGVALEAQWAWFARGLQTSTRDPQDAASVATRLVSQFVRTTSAVWAGMHEEASVAHWSALVDDDGRVTYGTTPSGRRARSTLEDLVAKDANAAWRSYKATERTVDFVTHGPYQRAARVARLRLGATQAQIEHYAGLPGGSYANGWENQYDADLGTPPWWWPQVAALLNLPDKLDLGPVVAVLDAPWVGKPGASF